MKWDQVAQVGHGISTALTMSMFYRSSNGENRRWKSWEYSQRYMINRGSYCKKNIRKKERRKNRKERTKKERYQCWIYSWLLITGTRISCSTCLNWSTFEPVHEISNNMVCATSKALDQPAHMRSLIRAFASCLSILWLLSHWLKTIWSF